MQECKCHGFVLSDCPRWEDKVVSLTLERTGEHDLGSLVGEFEAHRYPGYPLLDTNVEITISNFAITWNDKEKLMDELEKVIRKYQI